MTRELVFELSEIERIWFDCPKCKAEFPIAVAKTQAEQRQRASPRCLACGEEFPNQLIDDLNHFIADLAKLRASATGSRVRFSLTESED
jgi:transposase-like protein